MLVVSVRTDKAADFVNDGGDVEKETVLVGKVVELLRFFKESLAEKGNLLAVVTVGLVFLGEIGGRADHFSFELTSESCGKGQVVQKPSLIVRGWDVDIFQAESLCDREIDLESR